MSTSVTINLRTEEARAKYAAAAAAAGKSLSAFGYPALMELITPPAVEGDLDLMARQALRGTINGTVTNPPPVYIPPLPPSGAGVIAFSDFTTPHKAGIDKVTGFVGSGSTATTLRMNPNTSTKGPLVAPLTTPQTNPYLLLWGGGNGTANAVSGPQFKGFKLEGTEQGHTYHGMEVGYSSGAVLDDLLITGVPGSASAPPGETFALSLWHAHNSTVHNVRIDGRRGSTPVGATLFGTNGSSTDFCRNVHFTDVAANYSQYGFGIAIWQSRDIVIDGADFRFNRRAINCENCTGTLYFKDCDLRGMTSTGPHITVNTNFASAQVTIIDPVVDTLPLRVGVSSRPYFNKPQLQKVSDVKVYMGGVDVSNNTSKCRIGDVW